LVAEDAGVAQDHVPGVEDPAGAPQARGAVAPDAGLAEGQGAAHVGDAPGQARLVRQHLVVLYEHVVGVEGAGVVDAATRCALFRLMSESSTFATPSLTKPPSRWLALA